MKTTTKHSMIILISILLVAAMGCETSVDPVDSPTDEDTSGDSDADGDGDSDADSDGDGDSDSDTEWDSECEQTEESPELTCDMLDNDCNGIIDDVDVDGDGICDCLHIGILGGSGYMPTSNFEAWLTANGTDVTRTLLDGNPGIVTEELLAPFHVLLIDRIERELEAEEVSAIESFVKDEGRGMITLIGYNFDNNNPAPERERANSVLEAFGLAYQGDYMHSGYSGVTPTFDQSHEISDGITDVNFHGGMEPVDVSSGGVSVIFATVQKGDAGLAHQAAGDGGRIIVWGDEWLTFDADWAGYDHVEALWARMLAWVQPVDFCDVDIPPV